MIIPAPTLMEPRPREVRGKSPCLRSHSFKRGESQSHTPAYQAHCPARVRYPGASGGPRHMVVTLTETSGISELAVPFRKQTSLVQMDMW